MHKVVVALVVLVSLCYADTLAPGEYEQISFMPGCPIQYTVSSENEMNVWVVDESGMNQIELFGSPFEYFEECSCLSSTYCNVDCETDPSTYYDERYYVVVIPVDTNKMVTFDFQYMDDCIAVVAAGLTLMAILLIVGAGCCYCCLCVGGISVTACIVGCCVYQSKPNPTPGVYAIPTSEDNQL